MQQPPERPFVPRRTPTKPQPAIASGDFAVSRPFVPGADRERIESLRLEYASEQRAETPASLPAIERYLDLSAPSIAAPVDVEEEPFADAGGEEEELPPVEHFIDPLPAVEDFAITDAPATDWGETDWQQYDWRAAAALGEAASESEATTAWATTDWDTEMTRSREPRPTAAQAIASALDQIAQRIRDGELAVPAPGTVTDPASIAATLAALLGIRR